MFKSIKEFIFGKPAEAPAASVVETAPYKVELPLVQLEQVAAPVQAVVVEPQITDAVTQAPAKKARKPRAPKAIAPDVKKAATKKVAAVKAVAKATPKSKKV